MRKILILGLVVLVGSEAEAARGSYGNGRGAYANGRGAYANGRGAFANGRGAYGNGRGAYGNGRGTYGNGLTMVMAPELAACLKSAAFSNENLNYKPCSFTIVQEDGKEYVASFPINRLIYQYDLAVFNTDGELVTPGPLASDVQYIARAAAQSDLTIYDPVKIPGTWPELQTRIATGTAPSQALEAPSSQEMDACASWSTGMPTDSCLNLTTAALVVATNQTGAHLNISVSGANHPELWNEVRPIGHAYPSGLVGGRATLDYSLTKLCGSESAGSHCSYQPDFVYKCTPGASVLVDGTQLRDGSGALVRGASWIPAGAASTAGPDLDVIVCSGENACTEATRLAHFRDEVGYQPRGSFTCPTAGYVSVFWRTYLPSQLDVAPVHPSGEVKLALSGTGVRKAHEQDFKYREMVAVAWDQGMFNVNSLSAAGKSKVVAATVSQQGVRYRKMLGSVTPAAGSFSAAYNNIRIGVDINWHVEHERFRACSNDGSLCIGPQANVDSTGVALTSWNARPNLAGANVYGTPWFTLRCDPTNSSFPTRQATNIQSSLTAGAAKPLLNQFEGYKLYTGYSSISEKHDMLTVRLLGPNSALSNLALAPGKGYIGPVQ